MKLLLTGLSHKTAPVHLREKLAVAENALPAALHQLQNLGASEAVILSTCNRVEIALTAPDHASPGVIMDRFLADWQGSATAFEGHLYRLEARDAIQHLFRVASSLDSMVVGEPQILGQLKSAYSIAKTEGAVGGLLETVMTRAFGVAKRVRTETGIGQMAVSVSYAHLAVAFCRCMNIPARYCTGYLSDIGTPPPYGINDFAAWFEVYLGGAWHTFDPRNNQPRIGRILIARGRDASDVAITTTFGPNMLMSFQVFTEELL